MTRGLAVSGLNKQVVFFKARNGLFVEVMECELEMWTPYRGRTDYTVGTLD